MDLKKRLELGHSKMQTCEIVDYVNGRPNRFKELIEVYKKGPYRITQRAAGPLSKTVEKWPYLIDPHIKELLNFLRKQGVHDAVKRNTMRLLQFVDIPKQHHGQVADLCFEYLQNPKVAVAIRVFAMTVLTRIIREQVDLKRELRLILEDQLPYGTAAFKNRGLKVLKELTKPS